MSTHHDNQHSIDPRVLHVTTLVALIGSIIVAILPPALQFYYAAQLERGSIVGEAKENSRQISQLVGRNPQMWQFETLRINEFLGGNHEAETKRIFHADGDLVTEVGEVSMEWPTIRTSTPLYDAGIVVGKLEIEKSLRSDLWRALKTLTISALLAGGVFGDLRILPLNILRRVIDRAAFLASHDALTDLPNRTLFSEWLAHEIAAAERRDTSLAILCLDFDYFKDVNDLLGHAAGDALLRQATMRIQNVLRKSDILARLGGDEFAIIQNHIDQPNAAAELAERVIQVIAEPFDLEGQQVLIGTSIGITVLEPHAATDGATLLQQADLALYRAKIDGKGRFCFFMKDMNEQLLGRKQMETDLRKAIADDELHLHFQPQIDLTTNVLTGVEALLRWNHPVKGSIPPDHFIPLAEETGLILPIGEWVLQEACRKARDWPDLQFSVNVSPVQFRKGDLAETVRSALAAAQINPSRLEIEITEGVLLNNTEETLAILTKIQSMGVRIAMDDFGTGHSSLSYLRRFAFDKIKIDRSFISGLGTDADADNIVQAVISLGASLGMVSNAEGVETAEQAALLRTIGCQEVQGFYFSRPVPSASISKFIEDGKFRKKASTPAYPLKTDAA
tara:strand:+ start:1091 stop:2953 length:1863 start_codon:yes stop_codon:yes gene_type:complete